MSAIGPGDWVECIDPDWACGGVVVLGGIYCVEVLYSPDDVDECPACGASGGFELCGVPQDTEFTWCFCQFRPIYRPKSDFIEQLKQSAPDVVRELPFEERV